MDMSLKGKKYEAFLVLFGALLYVFILLICTGTLTSGYHLADDHEILLNTARFREGIYTWKTFFMKDYLIILQKESDSGRFTQPYVCYAHICLEQIILPGLFWWAWKWQDVSY